MNKRINREILALSLPNILSNISVPLISTVDTSLMGRLSETHLGAIGLGAIIFNFLYWNFGFLRMGTTGLTSQAYGRNSEADLMENLSKALLVGVGIGVIFILLRISLFEIAEELLNISIEHKGYTSEYFNMRILAAPASLGLFAILGWFFGMQNVIYPLFITLVINGTNILLSFVFVQHYQMGIYGAALGTVIAQYLGFLVGICLIVYKYRGLVMQFSTQMIKKLDSYKRFFKINSDIFIRTLCLSGAFAFFYAQSSSLNETILAVNVVLLQFLNWMSYITDGFANAAEALVGKYTGRKDRRNIISTINLSMIWGGVVATIFSLIYGFYGEELMYVFTDKEHIIVAAEPYLWWMVILPICGFACYIWDGVFIGLTASIAMRNSMIISFAVYIGTWYLTEGLWQLHSLWGALILFLFARGLIQAWMFNRKGLSIK